MLTRCVYTHACERPFTHVKDPVVHVRVWWIGLRKHEFPETDTKITVHTTTTTTSTNVLLTLQFDLQVGQIPGRAHGVGGHARVQP